MTDTTSHGALPPSHTQPVRPTSREEAERLTQARHRGPFVAWREGAATLRVHHLVAGEHTTIGRAAGNMIVLEHLLVSREHAEVLMVVRSEPESTTVYLHDLGSTHGTEHRPIAREEQLTRVLRPAGTRPAGRTGLAAGDHDVLLAGEVWLRIGAVPVDRAITGTREDDNLPQPTPRQRDVLVELCREQYATPDRFVPPPSNGQIAERLRPKIGTARVSDLVSEMYTTYELAGTFQQNRLALVELALRRRLVGPTDYE